MENLKQLGKIGFLFLASVIVGICATSNQNSNEYPAINIRPVVSYQNLENRGSVVYFKGKQIAWFLFDSQENPAETRALKLVSDLKKFNAFNKDPNSIKAIRENNKNIVKADNEVLLIADEKTAKRFGISTHQLAYHWANSIRKALGADELISDYSKIKPKSSKYFSQNFIGKTQTGIASWYGGFFHGQRASDGSRYNKYEFTAAHKKLPLGSLVKVTNLNNQKECVVKITDRGPYVGDRIIDLSQRAAEELEIKNKGVQKVKLEIIGEY